MSSSPASPSRRLGTAIALLVIGVYYVAVFRPLARKERDQVQPFERAQEQLRVAASNNPAISGLSSEPLQALNQSLRASLSNTALARVMIQRRFAPEPVIASNLTRAFQLIDYQNERLTRGDRLIRVAGERNVKLAPAVTAGLPEFTIENPTPQLLWGQLALMDGVLRAAVEARVQLIENISMAAPTNHTAATNATSWLMELPLRVEVVGTAEALGRWLGYVLLAAEDRAAVGLGGIDGLPGACLHRILARKETTDQPGLVRVSAEFSGFLQLPVADEQPSAPATN